MAAEILGKRLDARVYRIREDRKRHGFLSSGYRALRKKSAALMENFQDRVNESDRIILGTPIWAGNGTPAANGFIDQVDLTGKSAVIFTVQADPQTKDCALTHEYLARKMVEKGAKGPIKSFGLHGNSPGKTAAPEHLEGQMENWDIP